MEIQKKLRLKKFLKPLFIAFGSVLIAAAIVASSLAIVVEVRNNQFWDYIESRERLYGEIPEKLWESGMMPDLDFPEIETEGNAKIMVVGDLHFGKSGYNDKWADFLGITDAKDTRTMTNLANSVKREKPDLLVILGDTISCWNNNEVLRNFCDFIDGLGVKWYFNFGNDDGDSWDMTQSYRADKKYMSNMIAGYKNSLFQYGYTNFAEDSESVGNSVVNLTRGGQIYYSLFMTDTNSYYQTEDGWKHDGFRAAQVEWYRAVTAELNTPNMIFSHIPIPEYNLAAKANGFGNVYTQERDTDMFQAMKESGCTDIFAAHDHLMNFDCEFQGVRFHFNVKSSEKAATPGKPIGYKTVVIDTDNRVSVELKTY